MWSGAAGRSHDPCRPQSRAPANPIRCRTAKTRLRAGPPPCALATNIHFSLAPKKALSIWLLASGVHFIMNEINQQSSSTPTITPAMSVTTAAICFGL